MVNGPNNAHADGDGFSSAIQHGLPKSVLVIDLDPGVRWALERGLRRTGYHVDTVNNLNDALQAAESRAYEGIILELLPEAGLTLDTVDMFASMEHRPCLICVSTDASPQTVIDAMRRGAADFLPKPFSLSEIRSSLDRALDNQGDQSHVIQPHRLPNRGSNKGQASLLIGVSQVVQELRTMIEQVAKTDLNCLVRGESGTGKDMVAREIHRLSARQDKPFIKVNCTALPEQLLESELFGYEKGAFTGAVTTKPGRFELANKGIIFLDEIGDMHPNLQAKLLQVIEHKEFIKLGGTRPQHVDVQIIAATNADIEGRTRDGGFRTDLYFRLNEVCLWVPSLAQRKEDIPLLTRHFLQKHSRYVSQEMGFSGDDLEWLTNHDWPGNVRELESTIKRWLALGKQVTLAGSNQANQVPQPRTVPIDSNSANATISPPEPSPVPQDKEPSESERIAEALEKFHWNRRKAAKELGMSYQTLRRRIEKYGLNER